jgi:hypothetical protein
MDAHVDTDAWPGREARGLVCLQMAQAKCGNGTKIRPPGQRVKEEIRQVLLKIVGK